LAGRWPLVIGLFGFASNVGLMTNPTPQISGRSARLAGGAMLLASFLALTLANPRVRSADASAKTSGRSYGWPVAPFNRQHPIRGGFGDPRTVFLSPPTRAGLYHGAGSFLFHQGVDISAPDGTAVYPVADGTVSSLDPERVFVDSGGGDRFEYWHIVAAVKVGDHVSINRTVLGHIIRGTRHVHLTEVDAGRVTDPLLPGHLTPYRDTTTPEVTSIQFRIRDDAPALMPNFLRGSVELVAEAYDTPTVPVTGPWNGMPMTPALVTWRVETWSGKAIHNNAGWVGV
jgi:hypothetical protein